MIHTRQELEDSYQALAKSIHLRNSCATESAWSSSLRDEVADGIASQIRKIERDINQYLSEQPKGERAA